MTRKEIEEKIRQRIISGELTPEEAESEYDFAVNGWDSSQNIYGGF